MCSCPELFKWHIEPPLNLWKADDQNRVSNLRLEIRVLHPALCPTQAQGLQLTEFYSGATDRLGCFTEGLLLRRLHAAVELESGRGLQRHRRVMAAKIPSEAEK